MRRKTARHIEDLRGAIDCLPVRTREAMLHGIRTNEIIAGAYSDRSGGVCPMLAAHRAGGRTDFLGFARAWDRFTGVRRSRRATERELRVLEAHLEASLCAEDRVDLGDAIADHRELVGRRAAPAARTVRPGEPDRRAELRRRGGWAWMRPFRRLDDYERALARIEARSASLAAEPDAAAERELSLGGPSLGRV